MWGNKPELIQVMKNCCSGLTKFGSNYHVKESKHLTKTLMNEWSNPTKMKKDEYDKFRPNCSAFTLGGIVLFSFKYVKVNFQTNYTGKNSTHLQIKKKTSDQQFGAYKDLLKVDKKRNKMPRETKVKRLGCSKAEASELTSLSYEHIL